MPDGDLIHANLRARYLTAYKQLCEGKFGAAEVARGVLRSFKQDVYDLGRGTFSLLGQVSDLLDPLLGSPLLIAMTDWPSMNEQIEALVRLTPAAKRGKNLVLRAIKEQMRALREGGTPENLPQKAAEDLLLALYAAEFEERIPLTPEHYEGVEPETVGKRLVDIRPHIEEGINHFAAQIVRRNLDTKLRLPNRTSREVIELSTDLLSFN